MYSSALLIIRTQQLHITQPRVQAKLVQVRTSGFTNIAGSQRIVASSLAQVRLGFVHFAEFMQGERCTPEVPAQFRVSQHK